MRPIDEEELRRILDEGSSYGPADQADEFRRRLEPGEVEGDLPLGTRVQLPVEVAAPAPSRVPIIPKVLDLTQQNPDDIELAAAKVEDRHARSREAFERGTRQLIGGLTRTEALPSTPGPVDAVQQLYARRKAQDATRAQAEQARLGATKFNFEQQEAARKAAEDKDRDTRDFTYKSDADKAAAARKAQEDAETARHNRVTEGIGWKNASRPVGGPVDENGKTIPERRQEQRENALKPRAGWEPIDPAAPVFRSAQDGSKFDVAVASMGAIRNHRNHVLEGLEELKHAKSPADADVVLAKINAQMGALASKLRDAEGLNNTDASNHAVDTMLSLTGGSIVNLRNVANQGRLPAILNAAINSGEANLDTLAESNNLRRAKGGEPASGDQVQRKTLKDGRVVEKHADGLWYPVEDGRLGRAKEE